MIQKSYDKEISNCYIVPTPIGNMKDMTCRSVEVLKQVDAVFAEDTRVTGVLLNNLDIKKKIYQNQKFNEAKASGVAVELLKEGKNIAVVTDRGTPLISDPGNVIVDESIKQNITVIALPGPNALLPAINMSGLSNERFLFYGFLNSKQSLAKKELIDLKDIKQTIIFYESPHRITDTLSQILDVFGNRNIAIVREISKIHEEVMRDNIENILKISDTLKGEMVIIVEGNTKEETLEVNYTEEIDKLLTQGYSKRDAIREIADKYNVSKNKLYNEFKEN